MRSLAILAFCLLPVFAHAEEQVRTTPGYDAIDVKGPFNLEIEAGKAHSLTISGDARYFDRITTEVVDGRLNIAFKSETQYISGKNLPRIHVTLPALRQLVQEGVGQTVLTHIDGKRLDINYQGTGRLAASGKVQDLRIDAQGVGEIDTRDLIAQDARVAFEGVGAVQIYANHSLDVSANGMGKLTYYGHPRILNKSVSGLGSVNAGD